MIKQPLLDKRSTCHALLYSSTDPETMIPIKGVIDEIYFEEDIPIYSIRIIKFYDGINFLRKTFINKSFLTNYGGRPKPIVIPKSIHLIGELENWLGENSKYRFCVESNLVTRSKSEMMDLYSKINDYLIAQKFRFLRTMFTRNTYEGPFRINSNNEFNQRIERGFSDLFPSKEGIKSFIETI
jgi:hypothetical protein